MDSVTPAAPPEFWATVAQVIPVLALALVFESRVLAKRWSKKRAYRDHLARRAWAITAAFVTIGMVSVEAGAIVELYFPTPDGTVGTIRFVFAVVLITVALFLVISIPITSIVVPAFSDIFGPAYVRYLLRTTARMGAYGRVLIAPTAERLESFHLDKMRDIARRRWIQYEFDGADDERRAVLTEAHGITDAWPATTAAKRLALKTDYEEIQDGIKQLRGSAEEMEQRSRDPKATAKSLRKIEKRFRKALRRVAE